MIALQTRLATGCRKRRRKHRSHAEHHQRLLEDWFGLPAFTENCVEHESKEAWQDENHFNRRFRMGPKLFCRLLYEIQDPETGHVEFQKGTDVTGVPCASAFQKLCAVFRILAYGVAFDAVHDYTGVQETVARKVFYAFCDWLNVRYGGIYMGVWTQDVRRSEVGASSL